MRILLMIQMCLSEVDAACDTSEETVSMGATQHRDDILKGVLDSFDPITLDEMKRVALLERTETKFIFNRQALLEILPPLADAYRVFTLDGQNLNAYATQYFDTPEYHFYHNHHNKKANRYKIRSRTYVNSDLSFLEIKYKDNKNVTHKTRVETPGVENGFGDFEHSFIKENTPYASDALIPALYNMYDRITFVNKTERERVTIDLNIRCHNEDGWTHVPDLAIAEIKSRRLSTPSPFRERIKACGIRPCGFSKYCIGLILLKNALSSTELKYNRFKPKLLELYKIAGMTPPDRFAAAQAS